MSRSVFASFLPSTSARPLTRASPISFPLLRSFTSLRTPTAGRSLLPLSSTSSSSSPSLSRRPFSAPVPPPHPSHSTTSSRRPGSEPEAEEDPDDDPPNPSLSQRFKSLSKKYGWWAFGVYTALSFLDFSVAFAGVSYFGAERVGEYERAVKGWGYERLGWEVKERTTEEIQAERRGGMWTQVVVAYAIHKTLFLPIRLALTGAILPKFVAYMTRLGWAGGGAKGVKAKVAQVVKDRAN